MKRSSGLLAAKVFAETIDGGSTMVQHVPVKEWELRKVVR